MTSPLTRADVERLLAEHLRFVGNETTASQIMRQLLASMEENEKMREERAAMLAMMKAAAPGGYYDPAYSPPTPKG